MKETTMKMMYDLPMVKEEAKAIVSGEIGYSFDNNDMGQLGHIKEAIFSLMGRMPELNIHNEGKEIHSIRMSDEEILFLIKKQEEIARLQDMLLWKIKSVQQLINEAYDIVSLIKAREQAIEKYL